MPAPSTPLRALRRLGLVVSLLAAAGFACDLPGQSPTPTALVLPPTGTPVALTAAPAEPSATGSSAEPSATVVPAEPSATVPAAGETAAAPATDTPAPTAAAPEVPEAIAITSPGTGSRLTSPLHVEGYADPTFEQTLVIQITDANGAVLATQPTTIQADAGSAGPFAADVVFTTPSDQPGRISVFSTSARDGGLIHLASVEVDLAASGAAVVAPSTAAPEAHIILDPAPLSNARGGNLQVVGYSAYVFEGALNVWLCGEGGTGAPDLVCGTVDNILAQGNTLMLSPDLGQPGPFTLALPYAVTAPVQARLVVYSTSARDGGIIHLATVPVNLQP